MSTIESFDWKDKSEDHLLFGDSDMNFFFEEGHREQYVEQLLKLSQLDEMFIFVLGSSGIGKTSLLLEFIRRQRDTADCAYIEVPILADTITLLDSIAKQCDISVASDSDIDHYIYSIRLFIQENHNNDRKFILVIDDADGLPDDALKALLKLISKSAAPNFIFSSHGSSLQNRINALVSFYQTHIIDVKPLTEAEVVSYTDLYLSNYHLENNFSDDDIYDIFLSSSGNISIINKLINAFVDDHLQIDGGDYLERAQKVSTLQIPRLHIIAVIMAIIGLGALGIYFTHHSTSTAVKSIITTDQSSVGGLAVDAKIFTIPKISSATIEPVQQAPVINASTTTATQVVAVATIAPTQATIPKTQPSAVPNSPSSVLSGNWLAKAPTSNFTLQMMGSFSKESVIDFVKRQNNSKEWASYKTARDGKPWFVAVYGNYASKEAAKSAADKLPSALKKGKPWPKAISVIHGEMKR